MNKTWPITVEPTLMGQLNDRYTTDTFVVPPDTWHKDGPPLAYSTRDIDESDCDHLLVVLKTDVRCKECGEQLEIELAPPRGRRSGPAWFAACPNSGMAKYASCAVVRIDVVGFPLNSLLVGYCSLMKVLGC